MILKQLVHDLMSAFILKYISILFKFQARHSM